MCCRYDSLLRMTFNYDGARAMYKKYFSEFYVPIDDLQKKICEQLEWLVILAPNRFDSAWVRSIGDWG
jgi:hypothetical protein